MFKLGNDDHGFRAPAGRRNPHCAIKVTRPKFEAKTSAKANPSVATGAPAKT